jgi:hypothetical protein
LLPRLKNETMALISARSGECRIRSHGAQIPLLRIRVACLGSEETRGSDALSGPRDYDKTKKLVTEAGYKGEPVVLLDPADIPQLHAEAAVTADRLQKRLCLNVEVASTEWGTVIKRILFQEPGRAGRLECVRHRVRSP